MNQEILGLVGKSKTSKRRELDFYPTPPDATKALMNFLDLSPCTIWEPASGNGHMSRVIESCGHKVISTDIRTNDIYGLGNIDFFNSHYVSDAIITNPPFNLSEKFIRKAVNETRIVAMLLKSQYWHAKIRHKLFQECQSSYVLPLTWRPDFLFDKRIIGEKTASPTMECLWTVWKKGSNHETIYKPLLKP